MYVIRKSEFIAFNRASLEGRLAKLTRCKRMPVIPLRVVYTTSLVCNCDSTAIVVLLSVMTQWEGEYKCETIPMLCEVDFEARLFA